MENDEWRRVEAKFKGRQDRIAPIICERCKCTLHTYANKCMAALTEECEGFLAIEKARKP